jgi:response regulator of citrate/malate metabolism
MNGDVELFLRTVLDKYPHTHVIIASATPDLTKKAKDLGVSLYLIKPFAVEDMLSLVSKIQGSKVPS